MSRNLKTLGIALVAALALSGVAASSAFAVFPFTAPEAATDMTGEQVVKNVLAAGGFETSCTTAKFSATQGVTSSSDLTVTPTYSTCETLGLETHVKMNGCTYTFTTPTTKLANGEYQGEPPHIVCPGTSVIELTVTSGGTSVCTVTIAAQTPTSGTVKYKNEGAGTSRQVLETSNVGGIHYELHGGLVGCFFQERTVTKSDGALTGTARLQGWNDGASHTTREAILVD